MTIIVSDDKWRDGIKFLMGHGCGPALTAQDQRKLSECLRGPFAEGFPAGDAVRVLRNFGWRKRTMAMLRKDSRRSADRIDGYDRDDLGESPDF